MRKVYPRLARNLYAVYAEALDGETAARLIEVFTSKAEAKRVRSNLLKWNEERRVVVVPYGRS